MAGDDSEAKWLAEHVILPQYESLKKEMGKVKKCNVGMKMTIKDLEARDLLMQKEIHDLTVNVNALTKVFKFHIKDKKSHYSSDYTETTFERIKRKKAEMAAMVVSAGTMGTAIILLIDELHKAGLI